jgi:hypothetical protein
MSEQQRDAPGKRLAAGHHLRIQSRRGGYPETRAAARAYRRPGDLRRRQCADDIRQTARF